MFKKLNNNLAFTLIEMLVVLMIISILIILVIPNLSGKNKDVNEKGCLALLAVVQAQADSYYLDEGDYPGTLETLSGADYITSDQKKCPTGDILEIDEDGVVTSSPEK